MEELNCRRCNNLTVIPTLPNLVELDCTFSKSLVSIPALPKLIQLWCNGCTNLAFIPSLPKLKIIVCEGCINLTSIPVLPNITYIDCYGCIKLISVGIIYNFAYFQCTKCPWLNRPENPDFKNNLNKLIKAQKIIRRFLKRQYIKQYLQSEAFVTWWYSPFVAGGKKAKQEIEKLLSDLS